jgi:hypothetical protein
MKILLMKLNIVNCVDKVQPRSEEIQRWEKGRQVHRRALARTSTQPFSLTLQIGHKSATKHTTFRSLSRQKTTQILLHFCAANWESREINTVRFIGQLVRFYTCVVRARELFSGTGACKSLRV